MPQGETYTVLCVTCNLCNMDDFCKCLKLRNQWNTKRLYIE